MARIPRSLLPPGWYHCINRGTNRQPIFSDDEDYFQFEAYFLRTAKHHALDVAAYCLMPNHWHIVLECRRIAAMSAMFKDVLNWHTKRHHAKYGTIGHGPIYQGRYKSLVVKDELALATICQYVEMNPVKANLVSEAIDWRWSSRGTVKRLTPIPLPPYFQENVRSSGILTGLS